MCVFKGDHKTPIVNRRSYEIEYVKKTLAGAMVALMACTSMSAFAKPEWVPVGLPTHSGKLNEGTFSAKVSESIDETCVNWLAIASSVNPFGYTYKLVPGKSWVTNRWSNDPVGLACYALFDNKDGTWHDSGGASSSGTLTCEKGEFRYDAAKGTIGCYKYLDCDPALYPDGNLPEGCKPPQPKPPSCPPEPPTHSWGTVRGVVACNGKDKIPCTYTKGAFWSEDAERIVRRCTEKHEMEHVNDPNVICNADGVGEFPDEVTQYNAEIIAHRNSAQCLREAKEECGWNPICHYEIWGEAMGTDISVSNFKPR